jgi:hypothetical protein
MDTVEITIAALKLARPLDINLGDEERADVKAIASPAPLIKSILNGKNAVVSGTKRTPPPTPDTGAMIPIMKVNTNKISIQVRYSTLSPIFYD